MIFAFKNRFPQLAPIWNKYAAMQERRVVPARTVLLREGKRVQHYYFVEDGCLRVWFNNKGKDVTMQFFFENEGAISIESFQQNIPSAVTIESIEPTTLQVLPRKAFAQMIEELSAEPALLKVLLEISFARQRHYMNEFVSRLRDTPEERYAQLLKERPHIVKRVPQHYIASYLGISSVHLSRIKSKLARR
jgi:CRP-like cAMP-binding protein